MSSVRLRLNAAALTLVSSAAFAQAEPDEPSIVPSPATEASVLPAIELSAAVLATAGETHSLDPAVPPAATSETSPAPPETPGATRARASAPVTPAARAAVTSAPEPPPEAAGTGAAAGATAAPTPEPRVFTTSTAAGPVAVLTSTLGAALANPLPPVTPAPAIAPVIEGTAGKREVIAPARRPQAVVWTILGLLVVASLAWAAGDRRVLRIEETLGISQVITTGFPFVVLGVIARWKRVGIVGDEILAELSPLLRLGLGWIGLIVGFRFDAQLLGGLPRGTGRVVAFATSLPFALVLATTGFLLVLTSGLDRVSLRDPVFLRDALILGTAAAMTAVTATRSAGPAAETVERLFRIEELAGIAGLAIVAAYFRPHTGASWQLPGTAWLFLTVGLGATVGVLVYGILLRASDEAEFAALLLGSVSLVAGVAGYLHLSSVVVAFIVGAILSNVPGAPKPQLAAAIERLERPLYLLFLFVVGTLWSVTDWRGWVLMPVFAGARLAGKWLAARFGLPRSGLLLPSDGRTAMVFAPIGPLAIAIVVNAELLYPGGSISPIVSGVIGGAVLTEVAVQYRARLARGSLAVLVPGAERTIADEARPPRVADRAADPSLGRGGAA